MQFSDLRLRAAAVASEVTHTRDIQPATDWGILVNRAYADLGWETDIYEGLYTTTAVVGQMAYALPAPDWKYLFDVIYGSTTPGVPLVHSSEAAERRRDPLWLLEPPATPARYFFRPGYVVLIPTPPDNSVITVYGIQNPPPLVADSDTPLSPTKYDEAIAQRAAWYHLQPLMIADGEKLGPAVMALDAFFVKECAKLRTYLAMENGWNEPRRVSRAVLPRVFLDGSIPR